MKIPCYVIRTTQLFCLVLCTQPLQGLAITQVAACFQNTVPSITPAIPGDPALTDILKQPNCIKVDSVEIGAENPVTIGSSSSGIGAARLVFNSLTIKKTVDDASPILFMSMATGSHYRQIIIYFIEESMSAGVVSVSNLTSWQLGVAFVSKINTINETGLEESELRGTESVTVDFGEMRFTQGSRSVTWSQITNNANVPNTPPLPR
jgi:type VI protein secretion system component Hcp